MTATVNPTGRSRIKKKPAHIVIVSSEISPFAKTGGLGDVVGSLPVALERLGIRISLVMPAYRSVLQGDYNLEEAGIDFSVAISYRKEEGTVLKTKLGRAIPVYFIRADKYFDRENLYNTDGADYPDNAERFVFFSRAALELLRHDPPTILHANDWQTALAVVFLKAQPELYPELSATKTLFTIHNLGYQGLFWNLDWHLLNLDWRYFTHRCLEYYNNINFLKGGIALADKLTTVSPAYAREIQTPEFGFGLDGILHERAGDLTGILNGIDYKDWNPETDGCLPQTYSVDDLTGKAMCKKALQKEYGLEVDSETPLIGWVSRLTSQKGCDLLESATDSILSKKCQFVMLGTGDKQYTELFSRLPEEYPGRVGVHIGFDDELVHKVFAGADFLLIPSRYEPCGLTQIQGLRYGTPSIVRAVGGLKDTIEEFKPGDGTGTGFLFNTFDVQDFIAAIERALDCFNRKDEWTTLVKNAMRMDYSWKKSARMYKELYKKMAVAP